MDQKSLEKTVSHVVSRCRRRRRRCRHRVQHLGSDSEGDFPPEKILGLKRAGKEFLSPEKKGEKFMCADSSSSSSFFLSILLLFLVFLPSSLTTEADEKELTSFIFLGKLSFLSPFFT